MEEKEYELLVRRLENEALSGSRGFRVKVALISASAYLALALLLALLITLIVVGLGLASENGLHWVAFQVGLLGLAVAGIAFTALRAFLTPIPPPEGRVLTAAEAPRLFELVERVRSKLRGPAIDRVVIDGDFNAAIAQVPRFGIFGRHQNHLVLGLPLLQAMSTRELTGVLAHEYAHLAEAHGKLATWVYRQRQTFGALMDRLAQRTDEKLLDRLLLAALTRYAPWFNAYTFSLSRQDEYEADQAAARAAGAQAVADGLCRVALLAPWIDRYYWPGLRAQAGKHAEPITMPFAGMPKAFATAYPDWASPRRLAKAKEAGSGLEDTHPCLQERLANIEASARIPPLPERSAAQTLLGPLATTLAEELDAQWWREERADWQARHRRSVEDAATIAQHGKAAPEALSAADLHALASALIRQSRGAEARTLLEHLIGRPDGPFPRSQLLYGRLLLEAGDEGGLEHLRAAALADARLAEECAGRGYEFLCRRRNVEEATAWADGLFAPTPQ